MNTDRTQRPAASRIEPDPPLLTHSMPNSRRSPRRPPAVDRFLITYLYRELRSRLRQALLIALGLGMGVGLVVTVAAVSTGVDNAQGAVLRSLYGIGTDLTVTKPASVADTPGGRQGANPNSLQPGSLGLLPSTLVPQITQLAHVASVAGGLALTGLTESAGVPQSLAVDGVDVTHPNLGPLAAGTFASGHGFSTADRTFDVAVLDVHYAAAHGLSVGSTATLEGTRFHVIGVASQVGGGAADIYIPLVAAQALAKPAAGERPVGQVNEIYVAVTRSTDLGAIQSEIHRLLPGATVTSESDLAKQVSGSLASTAKLTNDLGKWVAAAALLAALAVVGLLTVAAVDRRVRELGTLKAVGWSTRRIVTQIMTESALTGALGALVGVAIGFAAASVVRVVTPKLTAVVPQSILRGETATVAVHLAPDISTTVVMMAVLLAIAGALVAGSVGAWRASRLKPADAFAYVD